MEEQTSAVSIRVSIRGVGQVGSVILVVLDECDPFGVSCK